MRNNFEEYGFTGDFEGEILKKVKDRLIGYIVVSTKVEPIRWNLNGTSSFTVLEKYNLTPIKKQWYKDESNFPCLIVYEDSKYLRTVIKMEHFGVNILVRDELGYGLEVSKCRPATREEVEKLIIKED